MTLLKPDRGPELFGTLVIGRPLMAWLDTRRAYRVIVDGQDIARLRNGETGQYRVAPGLVSVQLRIDWTGSPLVDVNVPPGGSVSLSVRWRGNLLGRTRYLALDVDE